MRLTCCNCGVVLHESCPNCGMRQERPGFSGEILGCWCCHRAFDSGADGVETRGFCPEHHEINMLEKFAEAKHRAEEARLAAHGKVPVRLFGFGVAESQRIGTSGLSKEN